MEGEDMKPLVIDLRYPREHAYAFPIKGSIHVEVDIHTPSKGIEACTPSRILHRLIQEQIIMRNTRVLSLLYKRIPAPEENIIVTIAKQDTE